MKITFTPHCGLDLSEVVPLVSKESFIIAKIILHVDNDQGRMCWINLLLQAH
jgi:hypothetical protein